jgi:galactokinase
MPAKKMLWPGSAFSGLIPGIAGKGKRLGHAVLTELFHQLYGRRPRVYRAPGRVNLIGEHTDYNDGFVMPASLALYVWVAVSPRADRRLAVYSENYLESVEFDLDEPEAHPTGHWSDYTRGVVVAMMRAGYAIGGADLLIRGEVPAGAGLSSSAAIEVATALALADTYSIDVDAVQLALVCQRAENEFVGVRCGIMDQLASCLGKSDHAMLLDCRSLEYRLLPLDPAARLVICNTMVKHDLAASHYNARRAECEAGARHLATHLPGARALRDVTLDELKRVGADLPETVFKRCRHVITENARVIAAASALERSDQYEFGRLMGQSHLSLRDDYEVSCAELDLMVELANKLDGVYGSRVTGGGFGGCTVNLVRTDRVTEFKRVVATEYEKATGLAPEIYDCATSDGAQRVVDF